MSIDAKATVKIGPFSRGGKSWVKVAAADHDFKPTATLTPVGIFLPEFDDVFLYMVTSKVTSDCLVDCLCQCWESIKDRFAHITTLVINLDNGPENNSRRTQFMKRIVEFSHKYNLVVRLVYYPPYHSKYNPVERVWGILENHWNGTLLDSIDTVVRFAQSMTWCGKHPVVQLVEKTYQTGVALTKKAMNKIEVQIQRLPSLEKWFVDIFPPTFFNFKLGYLFFSKSLIRKEFSKELKPYYWKPVFWSRSYCLLSVGGAPLSILRQYIENQAQIE